MNDTPTVRAILRDGSICFLDPSAGSTPQEVIQRLVSHTLTGSMVQFENVWMPLSGGGLVRYSLIDRLVPAE